MKHVKFYTGRHSWDTTPSANYQNTVSLKYTQPYFCKTVLISLSRFLFLRCLTRSLCTVFYGTVPFWRRCSLVLQSHSAQQLWLRNDCKLITIENCQYIYIARIVAVEFDWLTGEADYRERKEGVWKFLLWFWHGGVGRGEWSGASGHRDALQFAFIKGAEWLGPLQCIQIKQCLKTSTRVFHSPSRTSSLSPAAFSSSACVLLKDAQKVITR